MWTHLRVSQEVVVDAEAGLASLAVLQASQQQCEDGTAHAGTERVLSGFHAGVTGVAGALIHGMRRELGSSCWSDPAAMGGAGRAQTLIRRLAPVAFDWLATQLIPMLSDEDEPRTESDSLFKPAPNGHERSEHQHGRSFSAYTSAALHPGIALGVGLVAVLGVAAALGARRS